MTVSTTATGLQQRLKEHSAVQPDPKELGVVAGVRNV